MNDAADVLQLCSVSVHWEVRDSALEVILEMTRISQTSKTVLILKLHFIS